MTNEVDSNCQLDQLLFIHSYYLFYHALMGSVNRDEWLLEHVIAFENFPAEVADNGEQGDD